MTLSFEDGEAFGSDRRPTSAAGGREINLEPLPRASSAQLVEPVLQPRVVPAERLEALEVLQGLRVVAQGVLVEQPEVQVRGHVLGIEVQHALELLRRLRVLALGEEREAEVEVRERVLALVAQHGLVLRDGLRELALLLVERAEQAARVGIACALLEAAPQGVDGALEVAAV